MDRDVDWFIVFVGGALLLAIAVTIVAAPEWSSATIEATFQVLTERLGVVYIGSALGVFGFLVWLALSPHGRVVLGDGPPAYPTFSWAAMLFCAGIGASLLYWGATEWVFYYLDPPFGVEPRSPEAIRWATSYGIFHWGPLGWGFYCLPAVALGCSYHLAARPQLRLSAACVDVIGGEPESWAHRLIDLVFIVGLIGTAATGLGLGTSVVSSALAELTGWQDGFGLQVAIIVTVTLLISISVYRGLDDGIKVLSNVNALLALGLIALLFIVGPTQFILETGITAIGHTVSHFVTMATWTDPLGQAAFVENWTVFYWAWWVALGPFVGLFVCKISRGRTVRQVIFGVLGWGSLGCTLFFVVLGNFALRLELDGAFPVVARVTADGPAPAIAGMMTTLPWAAAWLAMLALIGLIFATTTYDSASYTLAATATRSLPATAQPARWHRLFWAASLGVLPLCLLYLGGLKVLQTASVVASVPILAIYGLMIVAIPRMLARR